jgi:hypothetical protein
MESVHDDVRFNPSPADISAVTRFLPLLEAPGFSAGKLAGGEVVGRNAEGAPIRQMPYFVYAPALQELVQELYDGGWIQDFDWPSWQGEAERYYEHPELVGRARFRTLVRLLTTHVRKDRFCEGHLAAMVEGGHVAAILRRLQELRGK